jgi:hypothetical protein
LSNPNISTTQGPRLPSQADTVMDTSDGTVSHHVSLPTYPMWIQEPAFAELRPDVVTPHTPWARPYAGRPLKLVVIAPRWTQRATLELQQRFDFDAVVVMTEFSTEWGDSKTPHYAWNPYGTAELVTERALAALRAHHRPDVIVIGHMDCRVIPEAVEQAILDALDAGAGLAFLNPLALSQRLRDRLDHDSTIARDAIAAVVDGIPTEALPPFEPQPSSRLIGNGLSFREQSAGGRIVVADHTNRLQTAPDTDLGTDGVNWHAPDINATCYLSPGGVYRDARVRDIHYDYYCSLTGRCLLWAARALPENRLSGWDDLAGTVDTRNGGATLGALHVYCGDTRPVGAVAQLTIRRLDSKVVHSAGVDIADNGHVVIVVPPLRTGGHYFDVLLRDAEGRTLDWGTHFFVNDSGAEITAIKTTHKSYALDQPVSVEVELTGDLDGAELGVEISDTHGRLLWQDSWPAREHTALAADVSEALTIQCELRTSLRRAGRLLATRMHRLLVRQPLLESDRFAYGAWAAANYSFVRRQAARVLADQGVTTGILGGEMDEWAALNVRPSPYATRYYPENTDTGGLMVRDPCLTDPIFLRKETAMLKEQAEKYRHYSPTAYSLGDDQAMMLTNQDACVSPTCLEAFRKYLAGQYKSIEALNDSWETAYTTFEEVMPIAFASARATRRYPAWADHRMYMDQLFVRMHRDAKAIIREVDPGAKVGFEGPIMDDSWYGYAWPELLDEIDLMVLYPNNWKFDIVRSFKSPGTMFGGWFGGYAMYRNPDDTRVYPWFLLFNGCNSYWFFSHYGWAGAGHPASGVAPDLRVTPCLQDTSAAVRKIQSGLDRLILGAERETDDVAVYFSRPSQHAATLMPDIPTRDYNTRAEWEQYIADPTQKWALNTEAILRLLDDLGLSYTFVDRAEIAAGALGKMKTRLLIMPMVQALSKAEAAAVTAFVDNGGAVLADLRPAVLDEHVKRLPNGQLDGLFGIKSEAAPLQPLRDDTIVSSAEVEFQVQLNADRGAMQPDPGVEANVEKQPDERMCSYPMPVDTTVSVAGGVAETVTAGGVPVFVRHALGQGQAYLLNMAVQHYLTLRAAGRGGGLRHSIRRWLQDTGIEPDTRVEPVGNHAAQVRVFRFRDGETRIVGLLRPHKRLLDEADAFVDRSPRTFRLRFPERGHVYDGINHTYLGELDSIELEIEVATPYLFAIMPYQVTAIEADAKQDGRTVRVTTRIRTSEGRPGRHVAHLRVTDAQGTPRPEYDGVAVAVGGDAVHTFTLALNDPPGEWMIDLEDVATGITTQSLIVLTVPTPRQSEPS